MYGEASKAKNHVFSACFKKSGVITPSLRIRSLVHTNRGREIAQRASLQFLNGRLPIASFKLHQIEDEQKWRALGLKRNLPAHDYEQV